MSRAKPEVLKLVIPFLVGMVFTAGAMASGTAADDPSNPTAVFATPQRDGAHDFDFLIGDWKAHANRSPPDGGKHWEVNWICELSR